MARVLMFGRLAERAGWRERSMTAASTRELRTLLADAIEGEVVALAVNGTLVREPDVALADTDEVAFMPPMSGG